jgi:hypothetical protein
MAEKDAVTIAFTDKQKNAIKRATGRTVQAMKVENARGRTVMKSARIRLTRPRTPGGGLEIVEGGTGGGGLGRPFFK